MYVNNLQQLHSALSVASGRPSKETPNRAYCSYWDCCAENIVPPENKSVPQEPYWRHTHIHTDCERFPNVSSPCSSPLIHPWLIKDKKLLLPTAPSAGILLCFPSVLPAFYSFLWREQQSVERTRANHVTSLLLMSLKTTVCENILVLREKKRMGSSALFLQMMNEYPQLLLQDK